MIHFKYVAQIVGNELKYASLPLNKPRNEVKIDVLVYSDEIIVVVIPWYHHIAQRGFRVVVLI